MLADLTFLPPELSAFGAFALVVVSFIASGIAAALGLGGGILMLAVMANLLPAAAIVPVHAVIQLGSNTGRAVMLRQHIDLRCALPFTLGSLIGVAAGSTVYVAIPADAIRLILGLFILHTIWLPMPWLKHLGGAGVAVAGGVAAFLTMFIGATGPFVATIWQVLGLGKHATVATHAAAMVLQHGVKILAFGLLGFAFGPWLPWLAVTILAGLIGTWAGKRLLDVTPDERFKLMFKYVLTLLALSTLWQGAMGLLAN